MKHAIALLRAWAAGLLAPTDPPPPITIRVARPWRCRPLRPAPEPIPADLALVRPYRVAAETRQRQAERVAILAAAIADPVRDWTATTRATGIAA